MGALITIDVHARDVVRFMVKSEVCSVSDFEWTKQLRYYWEVREPTKIARSFSPAVELEWQKPQVHQSS